MSKYPKFKFDITHRAENSLARYGILQTPHGSIETPNIIFCATKGAMKGVTTAQVKDAGADIILANTYHLLLQPGPERVQQLGGLHKMMDWQGPMLTDSGGFQIFSLGHGGVASEIKGSRNVDMPKTLMKITEDGAVFRSYIDGKKHTLTPEIAIQTQRQLGADFILVLDECTPFHSDRDYTAKSMERSHRWELRSLAEFDAGNDGAQALYGIVQGGIYSELREMSARFVAENPFFGQAVGGTLGGNKAQMHDIVETTSRFLHRDRPTHLLGIGGISDILNCVEYGMDTFDCVHPTRLARHGGALCKPATNGGKEHLNIKNSKHREATGPVDDTCACYCCRNFSRGYLHHLFKAGEHLGGTLLTIHNIATMTRLMREIREALKGNSYTSVKKSWLG